MTMDTTRPAPPRTGGAAALAIEAHDLVKTYPKDIRALDGLSFAVPAGTCFALLGPNGAGKSTTVKILTTLAQADSGTAVVAGLDVRAKPAQVRHSNGVVAQRSGADPVASGRENILLTGRIQGLRGRDLARRADELLGRFDLAGAADRQVRTYSGGMQRRLDVAMGLVHQPAVLFLDEPTAGLDPASRRDLWAYLRQERARSGTTVILTTHYLEEAEAADSVCVLAGGKIIERGRPAEVKERQLSPELVLDATDRAGLRRELESLGVQVRPGQVDASQPAGPLRVPLNGRSAQGIIASVRAELTRFQIAEPTLEDAYLVLLERAGTREPDGS
jgi:ABC-2 type transport system ATP-binding protein